MRKKLIFSLLAVIILATVGVIAWRSVDTKPHPMQGTKYLVSLGDSVAAGDGLPVPASSSAAASACNRSDQAYPLTLAFQLGSTVEQFACSGAKVTTGLLQSQTAYSQTVPPQISSASKYLAGNNVVLTIGANDVDWATMLSDCAQGKCSDATDLPAYQAKLDQLQTNLTMALQQIQAAHPRAVIVNSYYALLGNSDTCFANYGVTTDKITIVNNREAMLNAVLTTVAQANHAKIVNLNFSGHLLCDKDSWIQASFGNAPLHPNKDGQLQIAAQDLAALR